MCCRICHRRSQFVFTSNYYASTALWRATTLPPPLDLGQTMIFFVRKSILSATANAGSRQLVLSTAAALSYSRKEPNTLSLHAAGMHRRNAGVLLLVCDGGTGVASPCCPRPFCAINTGACAHGKRKRVASLK